MILKALNFDVLKHFTIVNVKSSQKFKIQSCSNGQNGNSWGFKMTEIDFTLNLSGGIKILFSHCVFPIGLPRSVSKLVCFNLYFVNKM